MCAISGAQGPETPEAAYQRRANLFDAGRAFRDLVSQVEIGPRHPGTSGALEFRRWALESFRKVGLDAWQQPFTAYSALLDQEEEGANILAVVNREAEEFTVISAHWDSRAMADRDPDPANRTRPVPAANDGASGVAVIMELARVLKEAPLPSNQGVLFALYDFEDQGEAVEEFALGSKYFAENIPTTTTLARAVNLDMVGDRNQLFRIERYSYRYAPDLVDTYWSHGLARFPSNFTRRRQGSVWDDHVHLNLKGIPSIDIIDFDYPPWHTVNDLPEACSPDSLKVAGLVTLSFLSYDGKPLSP